MQAARTVHQHLVATLVGRGVKTARFLAAIEEAVRPSFDAEYGPGDPDDPEADPDAEPISEWDDAMASIGRPVPDGYTIDADTRTIAIYEVEVTSPVNDWKLDRYVELFWLVDAVYWDVRLVVVDRFGNESPPMSVWRLDFERAIRASGRAPSPEFVETIAAMLGVTP